MFYLLLRFNVKTIFIRIHNTECGMKFGLLLCFYRQDGKSNAYYARICSVAVEFN